MRGLLSAFMWLGVLPGICFLGFTVGLFAYPFYFVSQLPPFKQALVGVGFYEDTTLMAIKPVSVQWATNPDDFDGSQKAITVALSNASGEAWGRFSMSCPTDHGSFIVYDLSGILPGQTSVRSYSLGRDGSTVNKLTGDCELNTHERGKPKEYNSYAAHSYGSGGWGDRLPVTIDARASAEMATRPTDGSADMTVGQDDDVD